MKNIKFTLSTIALGCVMMLTGCSTPKPVLSLATTTSANISKLGSQLSSFSDQEALIANLRAENMAIEVGELSTLDYARVRRMEAMRLAGQTSTLALYSNLIASSEKLASLQESIPQKTEQLRTSLLNSQKQLSAPVKDLAAISKSLATLGQDMNFNTWITFYVQYGQDVDRALNQQMKLLESAKSQATAANAKLAAGKSP